MGEFEIRGPGSPELVQHVLTNDASRLTVGQAQYTVLCNHDGFALDDCILYRFDDRYMLVVNAANLAKDRSWIEAASREFDAELIDRSEETGLLALQGPAAQAILARCTDADLDSIRFYHFAAGKVAGRDAVISRTGYTGEDGFEVFVETGLTMELWEVLLAAVQAQDGLPVGLGARDTLRLEAGMPLYGNELDLETNPFEAGLGRVVKLDKEADFVGKAALEKVAKDGPARKLVGLVVEGRGIARHGYPVLNGERRTGVVTSGTQSPTLGSPIAMAYVAPGDAEPGTILEVEIRDQRVPARVVQLPFYRRET
jgi:aminomethyltransferase